MSEVVARALEVLLGKSLPVDEVIRLAKLALFRMSESGTGPKMCIPAQPIDEDMVIYAVIKYAESTLDTREQAADIYRALKGLVTIIEKAGLSNLSKGVQLGQTSWLVKASDAMTYAKISIENVEGITDSAPLTKSVLGAGL